MDTYIYEAIDKEGKIIKGVVQVNDIATLKNQININDLYLLKYKKKNEFFKKKSNLKFDTLSIMCKEFSVMLNSGVSLMRCLEILHNQTSNKVLKEIYFKVYSDVRKGEELSTAMVNTEGAFSEFMINMVRAGEASGNLGDTMERISNYYKKELAIKRKIQIATIYPNILACVTMLIVVIIFGFIMPTFGQMFEEMESLPWSTVMLFFISDLFVNKWYILLVFFVITLITIYMLFRIKIVKTAFDSFKLNIPIVGNLIIKIISARFCYTMSSMLNSGLNLISALDISIKVLNNIYLSEKMESNIEEIKRGVTLSETIKTLKIFPDMMISMIHIGEEAGDLSTMMEKTSEYYSEEADIAIQKMIALLEPCMIIILGSIVLFVVVSIMIPIYDMYQIV